MNRLDIKSAISVTILMIAFIFKTKAQSISPQACDPHDSLILVNLYKTTDGSNWKNNSNWLRGPVYTWYGVTLGSYGKVWFLSLQYNSLNGIIPSNLTELNSLGQLSLAGNTLTGNVPNFSLPSLYVLSLANNQLTGNIPNFNSPNLLTVDLSFNKLTGSVPDFNLPVLFDLNLSGNQLSGSIPNLKLPMLTSLNLSRNRLTGTIPNFSFTKLSTLDLNANQLTGTIPNLNLPSLQYLDLGQNLLTGSIPRFQLPSISTIGLGGNLLSGVIPNFNLPKLSFLHLWANQLSGKLPAFDSLKSLQDFQIQFNRFSFDGLEPLLKNTEKSGRPITLVFRPQANIHIEKDGNSLYVKAGGTLANNTYCWFNNNTLISCKTGDSTFVPNSLGSFHVVVQNSSYPNLVLESDTIQLFIFLDPNPSLVQSDGTLSSDISKLDLKKNVVGASADGVTKVLILTQSSTPIKFWLTFPSDGSLSSLTSQTPDPSNPTEVTINPDKDNQIVAIYTAPDGLGNQGNNSDQRKITINATTATGNNTIDLTLVTPPVVLLHGMWSKPSLWETSGFEDYLHNKLSSYPFLVDYSPYSSKTFDPNSPESGYAKKALVQTIRNALNFFRNNSFAATQVDVIGHSLGGLIARSFSQQSIPFADPFVSSVNYNKGYYHKLITIGTPHRGSPLGPELWNHKDLIVYFPAPQKLETFMANHEMPIGSVHADFGKQSPGISHLAQTLPFKTFSITADYTGQNRGYIAMNTLTKIAFNKSLDQIMTSSCVGSGTLKHDLIVPLSSQKGFISGGKDTLFTNTTHLNLPYLLLNTETNSPFIQDKVVQLLLSNDTTQFGRGFPAPLPLNLAADCTSPNERLSNTISKAADLKITYRNQYIKITSPTSGSTYNQDNAASITLSFQTFNGAVPANAMFIVDGVGWFDAPTTSPYTVSFNLPMNAPIGKINIAAFVRDTSGVLLADTSSIFIMTNSRLDSLAASPLQIQLDSSIRQNSLYVKGYYKKGSAVSIYDLTKASTGTAYTIGKSSVITITPDGLITALKSGTDTVTVSNNGKIVTVPVIVSNNFSQKIMYSNVISFQTISDHLYGDEPFGLSASAISGDLVSFSVVSGPATILNGVLTITGLGKVTVKASQAGNVYFAAAPDVVQSFCVNPTQPSNIKGDTVSCTTAKTYSISKATGTSYKWEVSDGGSINSSDTTATVNWNTEGKHTITVTPFAEDCSGTVRKLDVVVTAIDTPSVTQKGNKLISSAKAGNQWFFNGIAINGATDTIYTPTISGNYSVQVTVNGCTSHRSHDFAYVVTAINDPVLDSKVLVFPNPFNEKLVIKNNSNEPLQVQLYDLLGKKVLSKTIGTGSRELNLNTLAKGAYVLKLTSIRTGEMIRRSLIKI